MFNDIAYPRILAESDYQKEAIFDTAGTAMRIHELCVTRWCYRNFLVAVGVPIPVIISTPSEAFADFKAQWEKNSSAFSYLYQAKDSSGTPLYRPFPEPPKFPLITIKRDGWVYDNRRSFSLYWNRYSGWPTVADNLATPENGQQSNLPKADLGNILQIRRPAAWNFKYQLDHYCSRPDTHAYFISQYMKAMGSTSSQPQVWTECAYPGPLGCRKVLIKQEGDIQDATEEEPGADKKRVFRASISLILEGWYQDLDKVVIPTMWKIGTGFQAVTAPSDINPLYTNVVVDERSNETNPIYDAATPMPTQ